MAIFTPLIILLPLIALLSGMAMTPVLVLLAVLLLRSFTLSVSQHKQLLTILALWLVWPLLTSMWSITPHASLMASLSAIGLFAAGAIVFVRLRTVPVSPRMIHGFAVSIAIACVLMLLELLPQGGIIKFLFTLTGDDFVRFMEKNITRGLCALVIFLWPAMLGLYTLNKKAAAWLLLLLVLMPLLTLHSASAKTGLVCGAAMFVLVKRFPNVIPKIMAFAIPLALACWPMIFLMLDKLFFSRPDIAGALPLSSQHRLGIWRFALEHIAEKPWLGWGMDSSRAIPGGDGMFMLGDVQVPYMPLHPHNSVLHVLLEQGAIGLILTLAGLTLVLRQWSLIPSENALLKATFGALIASYIAIGFTAFGLWQSWWIATGWIAASLCAFYAKRSA